MNRGVRLMPGFPMRFPPLVHTSRLLIRPADPEAAPIINAAIRESYDELRAWLPWADHVPSVDETREHLIGARAKFEVGSDHGLSLWGRDTGRFLGGAGLHGRLADSSRREIGYWLRTSECGQGYAREAVGAIAKAAFTGLGLLAVEIHTSARNVRSQRVAVGAGFTLIAIRDDGRVDPDGVPSPSHIYERRADAA